MQALADQLCTLGAAAAPLLAKAFAAGGDEARRALAAVKQGACPGNPDGLAPWDAWYVLVASKEFKDPATSLRQTAVCGLVAGSRAVERLA